MLGFDTGGELLGSELPFELVSTRPELLSVANGSSVASGTRSGWTTIRANLGPVRCEGEREVAVLGPSSREGRLVVVDINGRRVVAGAEVVLGTKSGFLRITTGELGEADLSRAGGIKALGVRRSKMDAGVAILHPPSGDLFVSLDSVEGSAAIRGSVDRRALRRHLGGYIGLVGVPVSAHLLEFDLRQALGDRFLHAAEALVLVPGGFVAELGGPSYRNHLPMNDFSGDAVRCAAPPQPGYMGCFRVSVPPGPTVLWGLAASADDVAYYVASYALSSTFPDSFDHYLVLASRSADLSVTRFGHRLVTTSSLTTADLTLDPDHRERLLRVRLPERPDELDDAEPTIVAAAFADLPLVGLIPLGLTFSAVQDGSAYGNELWPFGKAVDETLFLAMEAPPGREAKIVLAIVVQDSKTAATTATTTRLPMSRSVVTATYEAGDLGAEVRLDRRFLNPPRGRLSGSDGVLRLDNLDASITVVRLSIESEAGRWNIYSRPQSMIQVPHAFMAGLVRSATLTVARLAGDWEGLWALRNHGQGFDAESVQEFAESPCSVQPGAACVLGDE
ncbi:MAG: hypothetical protein HYU74_10935 [Dechloromonas sp.]|nr:hypothetical protein [Dechloromonas sp.]